MATPSLAQQVALLEQHMACAEAHPVLPDGPHIAQSDAVSVPEVRALYPIVHELYTKYEHSDVFREPVNALALGAYDYHTRIQTPMSLRDVLDGMVAGKYSNAAQVRKDIQVIWHNCATYNGEASPFTTRARKCEEWLEKKVREAEERAPAPAERVDAFHALMYEHSADQALLDAVTGEVRRLQPELIVDDDLDLDNMTLKTVARLEQVVQDHLRTGRRGR